MPRGTRVSCSSRSVISSSCKITLAHRATAGRSGSGDWHPELPVIPRLPSGTEAPTTTLHQTVRLAVPGNMRSDLRMG